MASRLLTVVLFVLPATALATESSDGSEASSARAPSAVDSSDAYPRRHGVFANLGVFSAVGFGGLSYAYAVSKNWAIEAGLGIGLTGVQLSFFGATTGFRSPSSVVSPKALPAALRKSAGLIASFGPMMVAPKRCIARALRTTWRPKVASSWASGSSLRAASSQDGGREGFRPARSWVNAAASRRRKMPRTRRFVSTAALTSACGTPDSLHGSVDHAVDMTIGPRITST